jgi:hypothetical protein
MQGGAGERRCLRGNGIDQGDPEQGSAGRIEKHQTRLGSGPDAARLIQGQGADAVTAEGFPVIGTEPVTGKIHAIRIVAVDAALGADP